jgi:DNA-binding Lrp family transcriptional regulator
VRFYWSAILDVSGLSDGDKLTYVALAACRNERTGLCNPSLSMLAEWLGVDRGTVTRRLQRLEEAGVIERDRSRGHHRTSYRLLVSAASSVPNSRANATVDPDPTVAPAPQSTVAPAPQLTGRDSGASATVTVAFDALRQSRQRDTNTEGTRERTRELFPAVSANSNSTARAEEETTLSNVIRAVRERRSDPLTRDQAREARRIARDRLRAGWTPERVVAVLVETSAFTTAAVDYAASSSKRRGTSAAERSAQVLRESIGGEP